MIHFKNIGQRQAIINITCPKCEKTFDYTFMQLPYPCYEARNEIDSERFDEIKVECPLCHHELKGVIYATREKYYIDLEGLEDESSSSILTENGTNKNVKLFAILSYKNASMSHKELVDTLKKEDIDDVSQLQKMVLNLIANIRLFISSKDTYPSQRKKLEELEEMVDNFHRENWNTISFSKDIEEVKKILPDFLKETEIIMSKWQEEEISLFLQDYIS